MQPDSNTHLAAALVATERALHLDGSLVELALLCRALLLDGGAKVRLVVEVRQRQVRGPNNPRFVGVVLQQPVREPRERAGRVVRGLLARQCGEALAESLLQLATERFGRDVIGAQSSGVLGEEEFDLAACGRCGV